jgi:hypothetical protein
MGDKVQTNVGRLKDFVDVMMSRSREVSDGWNATYRYFVDFIKTIVAESDTFSKDKNYLEVLNSYRNMNSSNGFLNLVLPVLSENAELGNFTWEFHQQISEVHRKGDLGVLFGTKVYVLLKAAEVFKNRCDKYLEGNKLDERFYR